MRHIHARSEQTHLPNNLTSIVADALRGAALAPTVGAALDVAGEALCSIASLARSEQPSPRAAISEDSFERARQVADETLRAFDRLTYLLEAIERLTCDRDEVVSELASIGLSLVEHQSGRVDTVFTHLGHCMLNAGVSHGL
jgi:hypothetical protein